MDCQTASLLIEAYHDDELGLVEAAGLLTHLEACEACRVRCDEAARLRDALREGRPVDRCPEELARRLARRIEAPKRARPRAVRPAIAVLAGGCGLLVGWAAGRLAPAAFPAFALLSRPRTFEADVFCVRCALQALWPGTAAAGAASHRPLLRTADGRVWVVALESRARPSLGEPGPGPRHVLVTAALDERTGLADVTEVADAAETAAVR